MMVRLLVGSVDLTAEEPPATGTDHSGGSATEEGSDRGRLRKPADVRPVLSGEAD